MSKIITLSSQHLPLEYKINNRSKKLRLRLDPRKRRFLLTLPPFISEKEALKFVEKSKLWIEKQAASLATLEELSFTDSISFLGKKYFIREDGLRKVGIWVEGENLLIGKKSVPKKQELIKKWIKEEAHDFFRETSENYAAQLGVKFKKIVIRDGVSRWGSCSSEGTLSYSWRLMLTPSEVAHYVCAHEVAHLKEMNHSLRFWKLVEHLYPDYKLTRQWLRKNGPALLSI